MLTVLAVLSACSGKKGDYLEHASGLKYKFHEMNPKGETPSKGDILLLSINFHTEGGLMVDENSSYRVQLANPIYSGDFFTGIGIMQVGDSAEFLLDATEYYQNTKKRDPPEEFIPGDKIIINTHKEFEIILEVMEYWGHGVQSALLALKFTLAIYIL